MEGRARTLLARHVMSIYRAALEPVDAGRAVWSALRVERRPGGAMLRCGKLRLPLSRDGHVLLVGAGKASAEMARAAERRLGKRIHGGTIVTAYGHAVPCRRVAVREAGHPVPDEAGLAAAAEIGRWVDGAGPQDLVLFLLSGGGSALLPAPAEGVTLDDKQAVTGGLLRAGAPIGALNSVRKHLSTLKGGYLARRAAPARVLVLVVSDVVGDRLDVVASGPAYGDPTTFADARRYLEQYGVWKGAPPGVRRHIEAGIAGRVPETPFPGDPLLARTRHLCVAHNGMALEAAAKRARSLGYRCRILTRRLEGEAREAGVFLSALAAEMKADGRPIRPPACLLLGGETTVTVRGKGQGGRSQELALSFALRAEGMEQVGLLAAGTDGRDGPTPAAGAFADGLSVDKAKLRKIDALSHLTHNDSYNFFRKAGGLIFTGPTRTNVMDLTVLVVS